MSLNEATLEVYKTVWLVEIRARGIEPDNDLSFGFRTAVDVQRCEKREGGFGAGRQFLRRLTSVERVVQGLRVIPATSSVDLASVWPNTPLRAGWRVPTKSV